MAHTAHSEAPLKPAARLKPELEAGLDCWSVFSPASGYMPKGSLNLGQGFMNWFPPQFLRDAVTEAMNNDVSANHYALPRGRVQLRRSLSNYLSSSFKLDRPLDPDSEILVTTGANFAIYAALMAFCNQGDEVIVFEPFFDQYTRNITFCGGKRVCVPIRPPSQAAKEVVSAKEWKLDLDEFRAAITPNTKIIILNTPHNPIGKVFDAGELQGIGQIAEEHDLLIISDEVYDCLTFSSSPEFVRIASVSPQLWNRTISVGSAGKSFSCTGWRLGWAVGPKHLINPMLAVTTRTTFCTPVPLQDALADGLTKALQNGFFVNQRKEYEERRDIVMKCLDRLGLPYTIPDGSYFVLIETTRLKIPDSFELLDLVRSKSRDWWACWFIAQQAGIVCIPPSDFYSGEHTVIAESFVRMAFCKDIKTLEEAGERLQNLKPFIV